VLVLSRRLNEKICFPGFRTVVQVVSVQGGAVRLGIEAPPEVTVLREEVQALPVPAQLLGSPAGPADRSGLLGDLDSLLEFASAGLELARRRLKAGRTQDAQALLDTMRDDLARLRQVRRDGREATSPAPGRTPRGNSA
jgi:carbon storage regulator CsrA